MSAFSRRLAIGFGIGIFLLSTVVTFAAEYTSPAGYTLQIPEGWVAANLENRERLPPEVQKYLEDENFDLRSVDLLVLGPEKSGQFTTNVNVVVNPGQIPVEGLTPEQFQRQAKDHYQKLGVTIWNQTVRKIKFTGRDVFEMNHDASIAWRGGETVRQRQLLIPGGGKTIVVTFTSTREGYLEDSKVFDVIQQTIRVPVETSSLGNGILSSGIRGGILGGLVGGAVAVFAKFRKKAPPATNAESDS